MHQAYRVNWDTLQGARAVSELCSVASDFIEKLRICQGWFPFYASRERVERGCDVADQFKLRPIVLVDIRIHGIDMDERALVPVIPEAWFIFDRIISDSDDHIGRVQELVGRLIVK